MNDHLSADALLSIGNALDWQVTEGLRHLERCDDCRAHVEALRLTRAAFLETAPVNADALRRISAAMSTAARDERASAQTAVHWSQAGEAFAAGITALVVLVSSRVPIDGLGTAFFAFALGAALLLGGKAVARRLAAFDQETLHV